jgi:hypothetical protein
MQRLEVSGAVRHIYVVRRQRVKVRGLTCELVHSPPPRFEVKNVWSYDIVLLYACMSLTRTNLPWMSIGKFPDWRNNTVWVLLKTNDSDNVFWRAEQPIRRSQWPLGLRCRSGPVAFWDCRFVSHRGHVSLSAVSVVCCQIKVFATSWSLLNRNPTGCGGLWVWSRNLVNKTGLIQWGAVAPKKKKTKTTHPGLSYSSD